tara:strand:- start:3855 stop:4211 length:357 start_codon:yes stop_codon:yes gene_type:complete
MTRKEWDVAIEVFENELHLKHRMGVVDALLDALLDARTDEHTGPPLWTASCLIALLADNIVRGTVTTILISTYIDYCMQMTWFVHGVKGWHIVAKILEDIYDHKDGLYREVVYDAIGG